MAISVTLLFRPSGSLSNHATAMVAAGLIAGPPNNLLLLLLQNTSCLCSLVLHVIPETRANARSPSGMRCSKIEPCLLRTPHWGGPICFRASQRPGYFS